MSAEPNRTIRRTTQLLYPEESYIIRGACYALYKKFRNTQKESIYQKSLEVELKDKGLQVIREKQLPLYHLGTKVGVYQPDILVNESIVIELKAILVLLKEFRVQIGFLN